MLKFTQFIKEYKLSDLSYSGLWCGEASLETFGIYVRGKKETCLANVHNALKKQGYTLDWEIAPWDKQPTLNQFIKARQKGDFIIFTTDHILALRDGELTDTEMRGGKRRVKLAYRVTKG